MSPLMKIRHTFLVDNTRGACLPVYEAQRDVRTLYATRYGFSSQKGKSSICVPLFPFTDVEVEDRIIILLLEAVREAGWNARNVYADAEDDFAKRDMSLRTILTSADHHLIPAGRMLALAYPEHLGYIVVSGDQRGVVLFNPTAVIGYKTRGRTAYEHVLSDLFA